jgi:MipA family protein
VAWLALSGAAQAQAPDLPAIPLPGLPDGVRVTVGVSAIMLPKYEGSSSYSALPVPIIKFGPAGGGDSKAGGGLIKSFDAKSFDDISFGLIQFGRLELGPLVGYRFGREEKDSPRLRGLGNVDGGFVAGGFAKYDFGPLFLRSSFHQRVTGDDTGYLIRLATGREYKLTDRITVSADAYLDFADDAYMRSFFGVTPLQSARSGVRVFDAGAGMKSAGILLGTEFEAFPLWTLSAVVGYTRLLGDAASSPVVETADRYEVRVGLSRSFDLHWK